MMQRTVTVAMSSGTEASPAAMLVQAACSYDSKIYLEEAEKKVNAKSIMGMMTLGLNAGGQIRITADGSDEELAVAEIGSVLTGK